MTSEAWIMLGILIVMFSLLVWNQLPAWIVFVGALTVTMTLNLAPAGDLLVGFANPGVATVGVLFPVAAGMYSTGSITLIADKLIGLPETLNMANLKTLPPIATASAFLNNTPLVAMMIPVVKDISQTARLAVSKLLIPLSFATILGGAATLIGTSSNLIVAGMVADAIADGRLQNMEKINVFDITWIALPAAAAGIVFIIFIGVRLLPQPEQVAVGVRKGKRLFRAEFVIPVDSPLVGKTVREAGFAQAEGYQLISLERADFRQPEPEGQQQAVKARRGLHHRFSLLEKRAADSVMEEEIVAASYLEKLDEHILQPNEVLAFHTDTDAVPELWSKIGLKPFIALDVDKQRHEHRLVEVVVAPRHPAVDRLVADLPVQEDPPYVAEIVAASRNDKPIETSLMETRVAAGDNAILEVDDAFFYEARHQLEYSLIRRLHGYRVQRTDRAIAAGIITLAMVLLAAFEVMSMLNAGLLALMAMLLTGCLNLKRAWRSIEWDTLMVLGAAIGLESAITATGLSQVIADVLLVLGGGSPMTALTIIFVGAVVMTNVLSNAAVAAFLFPVAVSLANDMGINFMPFAMILMLGISYAFINPTGYQTNLMVQAPGNYTFMDYVKIGVPLTILTGIVALLLAPIFYGF
jgi:di/tricarboxylate transporter